MTRPFLIRLPICFALAAAVCGGIPTHAVAGQTPDPAFKPAPLFSPAKVVLTTLPNGVRFILKVTPDTDLVSVQVWVKSGSRYESGSENGAAHLLETAAMRSTQNFPAKDDDSGGPSGAISSIGGAAGSLTSRDSTFYSAVVAAPYAATAVRVLADVSLHPDLSQNSVDECRTLVQNEIARRSLDGISAAMDLAYGSAYAKHPYRRPVTGTIDSVNGLTPARLKLFHDRQYLGSNITVVVVGDVSPAAAQGMVRAAFAGVSAAHSPTISPSTEAPLKLQVVSKRGHVLREGLVLAWRSPAISDPKEVVAMDTILSLWREGLGGNLRKALLRDGEKGPNTPLVASFDVDFLTQKDSGVFAITLADPQDKEAAVNAVLDEVRKLRSTPVSDEDLLRAKLNLRTQYIGQGETGSGQAGALGFYDIIDSYLFGVNYLSLCAGVTAADLQNAATKYLSPDNFVRAEVTPLPAAPSSDPNGTVVTARYKLNRSSVHLPALYPQMASQ